MSVDYNAPWHAYNQEIANVMLIPDDNNRVDYVKVAVVKVRLNRREVLHDGYCSDPGEDIGEWEYNVQESFPLNQRGLELFTEHMNENGAIDLAFLQRALDRDDLGCECGSGYCGYMGSRQVFSGEVRGPGIFNSRNADIVDGPSLASLNRI